MPDIQHEREICDLVSRLLFARQNEILTSSYYPEDDEPPSPNAVDAVYTTNMGKYVVEHTVVESYSHQITEDYKISKLVDLEKELASRITNNGLYKLVFDIETLHRLKVNQELKQALFKWIASNAPKLEIGNPNSAPRRSICDELKLGNKSLSICLQIRPSSSVQVQIWRAAPSQIEDKLIEQITNSFTKKIPKLIAWKNKYDAIALLILESIDVALVDSSTIADTLFKTIMSVREKPDIFFVVPSYKKTCEVWQYTKPFGFENSLFLGEFGLNY